jgi:hypothetical protein
LSRLAFYSPRWRILSSWRHFCRIGCYRPYLPLFVSLNVLSVYFLYAPIRDWSHFFYTST